MLPSKFDANPMLRLRVKCVSLLLISFTHEDYSLCKQYSNFLANRLVPEYSYIFSPPARVVKSSSGFGIGC